MPPELLLNNVSSSPSPSYMGVSVLKGGAIIRTLTANLLDDFHHSVAENSTQKLHRQQHIVLVKENAIEVFSLLPTSLISGTHIELQTVVDAFSLFDHVLDACVLTRRTPSTSFPFGDIIIVLSNSNLITMLALSPNQTSLQRVRSTRSLFATPSLLSTRPSRLLSVSDCGRILIVCSFEPCLMVYEMNHNTLELVAPLTIALSGVAWACKIISMHNNILTIITGTYTKKNFKEPNEVSIIAINLGIRTAVSYPPLYSFGGNDCLGVSLVPVFIDQLQHVLVFEEENVTLISLNEINNMSISLNGRVISTTPMPVWSLDGAEHYSSAHTPLLTSFCFISSHQSIANHYKQKDDYSRKLIIVLESGDVYNVLPTINSGIQFRSLGIANPSTCIAHCIVHSTCTRPSGEVDNIMRHDVLIMPGDGCTGSILEIDWSAVKQPALIRLMPLNNAVPINDFAVRQDSSIITCSGMLKHGNAQTLQRGLGTNKLSNLTPGFSALLAIIPLQSNGKNHSNRLLFSFVASTRVLRVSTTEAHTLEDETQHLHQSFVNAEATLGAALFDNDQRLVQCHSRGVTVIPFTPTTTTIINMHDEHSVVRCFRWTTDESPTSCAALCKPFVAVSSGRRIVVLQCVADSGALIEIAQTYLDVDVCSIMLADTFNHKACECELSNLMVLVGAIDGTLHAMRVDEAHTFITVSLIDIKQMICNSSPSTSTQCAAPIQLHAIINSMALFLLNLNTAFIYIGLRDGHLIRLHLCEPPSYKLAAAYRDGEAFTYLQTPYDCIASDIVITRIGASIITIKPMSYVDGEASTWPTQLIAVCERVWIIHAQTHRLSPVISPLVIQQHNEQYDDIQRAQHAESFIVAPFSTDSTAIFNVNNANVIGGVVVVARHGYIHFCSVNKTTLMSSVSHTHFGKTPRRVLYHASSSCVLVSCIDRIDGVFRSRLFLTLSHSAKPKLRASFELRANELVHSLFCWRRDDGRELACVGTSIDLVGVECHRGRLLVFSICEDNIQDNETQLLHLLSGVELEGVVYCITMIRQGALLVCSCSNRLYAFDMPSNQLRKVCVSKPTRNLIVALSGSDGNVIAVVDIRIGVHYFRLNTEPDCTSSSYSLHSSVKRPTFEPTFSCTHSDPIPRLVTRVLMLDEHRCVAVDKYGGVFFLTNLTDCASSSDSQSRRLVATALFNLGETASCIRKGSIVAPVSNRFVQSTENDSENDILECVLISTLSGSLYTIQPITNAVDCNHLHQLQLQMSAHDSTRPRLGGIHALYRCSTNSRNCIIDGDMILDFLNQPVEVQKELIASNSISSSPSAINAMTRLLEKFKLRVL